MGDFDAEVEPAFSNWNVAQPTRSARAGETSVSGYWPNWLAIPAGPRTPRRSSAISTT